MSENQALDAWNSRASPPTPATQEETELMATIRQALAHAERWRFIRDQHDADSGSLLVHDNDKGCVIDDATETRPGPNRRDLTAAIDAMLRKLKAKHE